MAGTDNIMSVMMHPKVWPELGRLLGPERADFVRRVRHRRKVEVSGPFMLASGGQAYGWPWTNVVAVVNVENGEVDAAIETKIEGDLHQEDTGWVSEVFARTVNVYTDRARYAELPAPLHAWIEPRVADVASEVFLVRPVDQAAIAD